MSYEMPFNLYQKVSPLLLFSVLLMPNALASCLPNQVQMVTISQKNKLQIADSVYQIELTKWMISASTLPTTASYLTN